MGRPHQGDNRSAARNEVAVALLSWSQEVKLPFIMERAYQEVIEGIAGGTTPQNVVAFRPSEAAKAR
ncbi:hypothetical protein B1R32_10778 [Abditibacterium utsteinense]|uniref:Uncharacterized protein n=1 Tax=Abditibacterium utsteinense TaxID=1960156 RepID=A0A2S8STC4_9BACT|nr:hypothetical protein [Abditibacterium utsteinense]PQV64053.1 hypothetical protein B1R32_10778 [Abditibacterium utsteinense]